MSIHVELWDATFQFSFWLLAAPIHYMLCRYVIRVNQRYTVAVEHNGELQQERDAERSQFLDCLQDALRWYDHAEKFDKRLRAALFDGSDYLLFKDTIASILKRHGRG